MELVEDLFHPLLDQKVVVGHQILLFPAVEDHRESLPVQSFDPQNRPVVVP